MLQPNEPHRPGPEGDFNSTRGIIPYYALPSMLFWLRTFLLAPLTWGTPPPLYPPPHRSLHIPCFKPSRFPQNRSGWMDGPLCPHCPTQPSIRAFILLCGINVAFVHACFPLSHFMFTFIFPRAQHGGQHLVGAY